MPRLIALKCPNDGSRMTREGGQLPECPKCGLTILPSVEASRQLTANDPPFGKVALDATGQPLVARLPANARAGNWDWKAQRLKERIDRSISNFCYEHHTAAEHPCHGDVGEMDEVRGEQS